MGALFQTSSVRAKTPRTTNRFSLRFTGLQGVLDVARQRADTYTSAAGVNANRYNQLISAIGEKPVDELELSIASVTIPSIELETADVFRFNDSVKHITRFAPMGDMTVEFYDYINGSSSAIIHIWHGLVGDKRTGSISFKEEYTLPNARLIDYGPKAPGEPAGQESIFAEHVLVNIYPKTVEIGQMSFETAEVRKITCQFAVESVYPDYYRGINVAVSAAAGGTANVG